MWMQRSSTYGSIAVRLADGSNRSLEHEAVVTLGARNADE
jgi:hypothetical protein